MNPRRTTGTKAAMRHEIELAAAAAREAVVQLHVERARNLIDHAMDRVPVRRMLDIYMRLQKLAGTDADVVATRVFASMAPGADVAREKLPARSVDAQVETVPDEESLLAMLRRRLRGRIHGELRRTVELQTGVTQTMLLELHVRHAHNFVRILGDTHGISDACALYTEHVPTPSHLAGVLYTLVLNRLAVEEMPRAWMAVSLPPPQDAVPETEQESGVRQRAPRPHRTRRPA